ncbi:MAG: MBL fold metallo-hydrolase [Syntrophales bacterium]
MGKTEIIAEGIYLIGGPNISYSEDATVFVIDFSGELVMIDSGAGRSARILIANMEGAGLDPSRISTVVLTHCHIDHIGAAPYLREKFKCRLIAHEEDAGAIETADPVLTAANWYDTDFPPTEIDIKLSGQGSVLEFGGEGIHWLHTPGHTPGSLSLYLDRQGKRILFGQDIHGPFLPSFRSDLNQWRASMRALLDLHADVLCEGHFGIFRGKEQARNYIERHLRMNS